MRPSYKQNIEINKRSTKENFSTLKRLASYLNKYHFLIFFILILTLLSNAFNLIAPKFIEKIISMIETNTSSIDLYQILSFALIMLLFYIISFILSVFLSYIMLHLGQNIGYKLRENAFNKFATLPVSYFDKHSVGDTMSRFTYDIENLSNSLGQNFIALSTSLITLIGSFVMMMSINFHLMAAIFIAIPIGTAYGIFWSIKVRALHRKKSQKLGELSGFIEDKISGHRTLKVYGQVENILEKLKIKNNEWGQAHYRSEFIGNGSLRSGLQFVSNLTNVIVYTQSCFMLLSSQITLAEISAFLLYAKMFTGILNHITFVLADIQSNMAAADRVFNFIDTKDEKQDNENSIILKEIKGDMRINKLSFQYDDEREILKDINFEVKPQEIIAIVGHTGAGKTTLINLLMRFYHASKGTITLDGISIEDININEFRKSCAMVLQDSILFSGTIFENIAYAKPDTNLEEVIEVAKAASLHDFILSLPHGYDTMIHENSMNISAGQKQLITIARVMLLNSKILLLDEATSNVDSLTELQIQESMSKLMQGKTVFVIAHRLSTVKNADRIIVLENGKIIEHGTHEELLKNAKHYANLYNSQFKNLQKIEQ